MFQPSKDPVHAAKLNFTSGDSFCWPCCWNVSIVLPEGSLWRAKHVGVVHSFNKELFIINVCIRRYLFDLVTLSYFDAYTENTVLSYFDAHIGNIILSYFDAYTENTVLSYFDAHIGNIIPSYFDAYTENTVLSYFDAHIGNIILSYFDAYTGNAILTYFDT